MNSPGCRALSLLPRLTYGALHAAGAALAVNHDQNERRTPGR
jgi:hypothetical protein